MINLEFTEEEKNSLYYERFHHPHPRVQLKMEVLWLKSQKIPHKKICQLAGISPNTLLTYLRDYQEGGIEKLKEINFYRPKSELESQRETLKKYFEKNPPATINEAVYRIEELTGIKRSPTQVRKFLKSLGMKCLKIGSLPSKADPDEQERLFVKSPSGRKRFNVLGALNAITHEVILVTNDTYITATQVCELLEKIAALGLMIPITLVLDNARYQKCKIVEELALSLSIELLYLPSYSPNLNLIERLWKFVKKKCLYGKYYENFSDFSSAIYECLNDAHLKHKKELDSLLTLRFQKFNKSQIMNV